MHALNAKRASTAQTPSPPSSIKRTKTEHHDTKPVCYTPAPLPLTAPHGVERIPLSSSLNVGRLSAQYVTQLASERIDILRQQGRQVVGLPLVLNDGIVLHWVHHKSGSADDVRPRHSDDNGSVVRYEKLRFPVLTGDGTGISPADAIIVDSGEGISGVSSLCRTDAPRDLSVNPNTRINENVVDGSDSDMELCSSVDLEDKVADPEGSYHSSLSFPVDVPGVTSSDPPPKRTSRSEEDAAAPSGFRSYGTDLTTSDSEVDGENKEVDDTGDVSGNRISGQHSKPLSVPSLKPIRELLERGKRRGEPEHDVPPGVSKKQENGSSREATAITRSESEEGLGCPASDVELKRVPLPKTDHGRARRLLVPQSADLPLVAVTMRGDCHFIERKKKYRISGYSLPNPGVFRHVGDVCMVGDTAVLGCDKGTHQISFLSVAGKPRMIDVTWSPHSSGPRYRDMQKRGVSRLAAVHAEDGHIKFLSGGYDGTIHEWTAGIEKLSEPRSRKVVSHGANIIALAYRDRDRSVMASAQKRLHITDLNRCKTVTHPFSNDIQQIHIHPQAAYITLLEVRHLDRQIQLYDSRKRDFGGEPCLSFGHRNTSGKFSEMHTRGSVHLVHFAMASGDGGVLLWDFRNGKSAVIERRFQQAEKVVHTVFADGDIATFGQGVVTFFEDYLAR